MDLHLPSRPEELVELVDPFKLLMFRAPVSSVLQLRTKPNVIRTGLSLSPPVRLLLVNMARTCPIRLTSLALDRAPDRVLKLVTDRQRGSPQTAFFGVRV